MVFFRITTSSRHLNSLSIRSSLSWRNATEPNWIVSVADTYHERIFGYFWGEEEEEEENLSSQKNEVTV